MVAKPLLELALALYLQEAYRDATPLPAAVQEKLAAVQAAGERIPETFFEPAPTLAGEPCALRLGQPLYPHMKLVVEFCGQGPEKTGPMFRVDAHDLHLHAPPGSPDEAWLQQIRASNKDTTERIEAAWMAAGVPTFKGFLRQKLEERKRKAAGN